jgi:hypothetical protein
MQQYNVKYCSVAVNNNLNKNAGSNSNFNLDVNNISVVLAILKH